MSASPMTGTQKRSRVKSGKDASARKQSWDFNPKRGLFYFLMGWVVFPLLIVVESISGADISLSRMFVGTFVLSALVGVFGTFTENIGV